MTGKIFYLLSIFLIIFSGVCCKQNMPNINKTDTTTSSVFWGDSTLAKENYFKTVASEHGSSILKKQNNLYLKKYSDYNSTDSKSTNLNAISVQLLKQSSSSSKEFKVNFFTYDNGKKIDSLDFYRNISGDGFGEYNCLSYFDQKNNRLWQIKYFPSKGKDPSYIISYSKSSITSDGKIEQDSLYYLDESLEEEMDKYNLYY